MALTQHQRRHVTAALADVPDLIPSERGRAAQEYTDLLNGTTGWPNVDLEDSEIGDWVEDINGGRANLQALANERRIDRGG